MLPEQAEELESSPSTDSQDVTEPSSSSDVEHESMEAAIMSVVGSPDEDHDDDAYINSKEETVQDSSSEGEQEGEPTGEPEPEAVGTDESFIQMLRENDVPLGKIERFQEIIQERNDARTENEQLVGVRDNISNLETHARQAGMSQDQIVNWFSMPVLLANEPEKAQEMIQGFLNDMALRTGSTLSPELQQKVDDGYMDKDSAAELSRTQAQLDQNQRKQEQEAEDRRVTASADAQDAIVGAVNSYQQSVQESDPDYSPEKHEFVKRELTALVAAKGMPETPAEAVALAKEAHKQVSARLSSFKPKPQGKRTLSGRGT